MDAKLGCLFAVVALLGSVVGVLTQCKTPWEDCGSTGVKITNVVIPNCCQNPCVLKRGANNTVTVDFTPSK